MANRYKPYFPNRKYVSDSGLGFGATRIGVAGSGVPDNAKITLERNKMRSALRDAINYAPEASPALIRRVNDKGEPGKFGARIFGARQGSYAFQHEMVRASVVGLKITGVNSPADPNLRRAYKGQVRADREGRPYYTLGGRNREASKYVPPGMKQSPGSGPYWD